MEKIAAVYARVSPTKHIKTASELHASLEESLRICRNDAKHEEYELTEEYIDEYVSGKQSKNMPSFQRMLKDAKIGKFTRIYCRRVNRFGRNRADMIKAEIELSEMGVSLKFVENGIDTAKPFGKSIMAILGELAEQDREEILRNTQRGRKAYAEQGGTFGPPVKEIHVSRLRQFRLMPVADRPSWKELETMFGACRSTLIQRLKDAGYWDYENRTVK